MTLNRSRPILTSRFVCNAYVFHYLWAGFLFKTRQSEIEKILHLFVYSRPGVPEIAGCSLCSTQPFTLFPVFRHLQYFSNKHAHPLHLASDTKPLNDGWRNVSVPVIRDGILTNLFSYFEKKNKIKYLLTMHA